MSESEEEAHASQEQEDEEEVIENEEEGEVDEGAAQEDDEDEDEDDPQDGDSRAQEDGAVDEDAEEDQDDQEDIDEEKNDDKDEGSSDTDSSDDSDSSSSDDENGATGLSLKDRRLLRIKKNDERLASLGLANHKIVVAKKPKQQRKREKVEIDPNDIRKSSRSSKKEVDYAKLTPKWAPTDEKDDKILTSKLAVKPAKKRNRQKEKPKEKRLERFIYLEFRRIKTERKDKLKFAEKQFRYAMTELKHASKRAEIVTKKSKRKEEIEQLSATLASERAKFGMSMREIMQDIDRRQDELRWVMQNCNNTQMSAEKFQAIENQRLEQERKMEMIDAINRFPTALKDAVQDLNFLLVERAPRDPPPPRHSNRKRKSEDGVMEPSAKKKAKAEAASPGSYTGGPSKDKGEWQNLAAAIAAEPSRMSETAAIDDTDAATSGDTKSSKKPKKGKKKNRNVGGWVDPNFAKEIKRSWLQVDKYDSSLDLSRYEPQIGDIVLYYPSGHRAFLKRHPDVLGKKIRNITRMTLWERARKEKGKLVKGEGGKDNDVEAVAVASLPTATKQLEWWNDEWLAGVEGELGNYPLICRVERTHAEFPSDPDAESETVTEDGVEKIVFTAPPSGKVNKKRKISNPPLCLIVMLRPMTPLLPPELEGDSCTLALPPLFNVVSFPSKCVPFLIPFGVAYRSAHSLTLDQKVKGDNQSQRRGIVKSFSTLGRKYGTCRLDDKVSRISELFSFLKGEGATTLVKSLESSLTLRTYQKSLTLPLAEAGIVIDKMAVALGVEVPSTNGNASNWNVEGKLITLIRTSLPLWKGISVLGDDRKLSTVSPWELNLPKGSTKSQLGGLFTDLTNHVLAENGLMYHVDEALRAKVECALEDFTERNVDTYVFWDPVTDDFAPSYSCAVPLVMCFQKILRRLSSRKAADEVKHCYYRSLDSLLCDVGTILDNSMLYNSADSEVVEQGLRVIPQAKMLIEQVAHQHQKERAARAKGDEERKKKIMRQYNVAACVQSNPPTLQVAESKTKSRRSSISKAEKNYQVPFLEPLNRAWIEQSSPDSTWQPPSDLADASAATSNMDKSLYNEWVPQSGDFVLYSRQLHSEFIKGHNESLLTDQCNLPQFVLHAKDTEFNGSLTNDNEAVTEGVTVASRMPPKCHNGVVVAADTPAFDGCATKGSAFPEVGEAITSQASPSKEDQSVFDADTQAIDGCAAKDNMTPVAGKDITNQALPTKYHGQVEIEKGKAAADGEKVASPESQAACVTVKVRSDHLSRGDNFAASFKHDTDSGCTDGSLHILASAIEIDGTHQFARNQEFPVDKSNEKMAAVQKVVQEPVNNAHEVESCAKRTGHDVVGALHSKWLVAKIVWIRRVFPRNPTKKHVEKDTFDCRSPLLSIGLCFDYEWSRGEQIHTLYWRPCRLSNGGGSNGESENCSLCGCQATFGFLLPAWLYRSSQEEWFANRQVLFPREVTIASEVHFGRPAGLSRDDVTAINRCLNMLKRRCIARVPPDYVDEKLTIANVKKGWNPPIRMGNKAAPTFEYIIEGDAGEVIERVSSRQLAQNKKWGNKEEQAESIPPLAELHYLPPFSKVPAALPKPKICRSSTKQHNKGGATEVPFESSMCPSPNLCLELIQQRVRNGYYRQKTALLDDIQEAYVASVVLVLSKQASQKFAKLSIKKTVRALNARVTTKTFFSKKGKKKSALDDSTIKSPSDDTNKKGQPKSEEEALWIDKIQQIRSLYSMALVSVSDTLYVERIFGTAPRKVAVSKAFREHSQAEQCIKNARRQIHFLLAAFGRDAGIARSKAKALRDATIRDATIRDVTVTGSQEGNRFPTVLVKIANTGSLTGETFDEIIFTPKDYSKQERLVTCFFGKPGLTRACGRCQVYRRSMLVCRVQRGHSNKDFDWDIMRNAGGVEGILFATRTGKRPPPRNDEVESATDPAQKESYIDATNKDGTVDTLTQTTPASSTNKQVSEEALANLKKSKRAVAFAQKLLEEANKISESPLLLSDEFIRISFPIDPADEHYNYCSICSLSGDVICCEKCPNVMHPKCTGIDNIPDGDWFCPKCRVKENAVSVTAASELNKMPTANDAIELNTEAAPQIAAGEKLDASHIVDGSTDAERETMQTQLEELLQELRDFRHVNNPTKYKKQLKKVANATEPKVDDSSVHDVDGSVAAAVHDDSAKNQSNKKENGEGGSPSPSRSRRKPERLVEESSTKVDEESADLDVKGSALPIGVGSKVSKAFGKNGHFMGLVKSLPTNDYPFYEIRYEDGDVEDLDEAEIRKVLIFRKAPRKRSHQEVDNTENPPKKKGRHSTGSQEEDDTEKASKKKGRRSTGSSNMQSSKPARRQSSSRVFQDPMDALSTIARAFLTTINLSDADVFLETQTSVIANTLPAFRKKEKMPPLKGSGTIATISGWKGLVRKAAAASGKLDLAATEVKWGHRNSPGGAGSIASPKRLGKARGSPRVASVVGALSPQETQKSAGKKERQSRTSTSKAAVTPRGTSRSRSRLSLEERKPAARRSSRGRRSESQPESQPESQRDKNVSDEEEENAKQSSTQSRAKSRSDSPAATNSTRSGRSRSRSSTVKAEAAKSNDDNTEAAVTPLSRKRRRTRRSYS